jgi:predicted acyltransferase
MAVLFLNDQRMRGRDSILAYLTSVGIGVIIVENWEDLWLAKKKEILIKKWVKQDIFASYIIGHIYFENKLRK